VYLGAGADGFDEETGQDPLLAKRASAEPPAAEEVLQPKPRTVSSAAASAEDPVAVGLTNEPWYHGGVTRQACEALLCGPLCTPGSFLVRESGRGAQAGMAYSLSYRDRAEAKHPVKHYKIELDPGTKKWKLTPLKIPDGMLFDTVAALIAHYQITAHSGSKTVSLQTVAPRTINEQPASTLASSPGPLTPTHTSVPSSPAAFEATGTGVETAANPVAPPRSRRMTKTDFAGNASGGHAESDPVAPQRARRMTQAHDDSRDSGTYVALPMLRSYTTLSRMSSVKSTRSMKGGSMLHTNDDGDGGGAAEATPNPVEQHGLLKTVASSTAGTAKLLAQGSKRLNTREMKGYLEKRGGMKGTKGWDKRWFHLDSENKKLFYFHTEDEECEGSKPLGIIPLRDMVQVRSTSMSSGPHKHAFRFELETHQRTWLFNADSAKEMTEWMMTLGGQIMSYVADPDDDSVGGRMANAEHAGFIRMRGDDFLFQWKRRYLAVKSGEVCYYNSYEDYIEDIPVESLNCQLMTVKVAANGTKKSKHQFQVVSPSRTYEFQAESKEDLEATTRALTSAILFALEQMMSGDVTSQTVDKSGKITHAKVVETLYANASNRICADCGAPEPDWASINLGITFCIDCCGIHRGLGVHISKCRGTTLDEWNTALIDLVVGIGNAKSNALWEATLPPSKKPTPESDREAVKSFIEKKYRDRTYLRQDILKPDIGTGTAGGDLNARLLANATTSDLGRTLELILAGASQHLVDPLTGSTVQFVAAKANQQTQATLLQNNGFKMTNDETELFESGQMELGKKGWLSLNDPSTAGKSTEMWFVIDLGVLTYFQSIEAEQQDGDPVGLIAIQDMIEIAPDPKGDVAVFTIRTEQASFNLTAGSAVEQNEWIKLLQESVEGVAVHEPRFNFSECGTTGKLSYSFETGVDLEPGFFAIKGKELLYFTSDTDATALGHVDLGSILDILPGTPSAGSVEEGGDVDRTLFYLTSPEGTISFQADSADLSSSWQTALKNTRAFGAAIESNTTLVPAVVEKCCFFVENRGLFSEGVYRLSGQKGKINHLRQCFNQEGPDYDINPDQFTLNDVASLLKQYFRELPDPLLTHERQDAFIAAVKETDHNAMLYKLQDVVRTLPPSNLETLKRMCIHLHLITEHSDSNKMKMENVAMLFGPTLMTCDASGGMPMPGMGDTSMFDCVRSLVTYHEWIFELARRTSIDIQMKEARGKIEALVKNGNQEGPTIVEIFSGTSTTSHTVPVMPEMTSQMVAAEMVKIGKFPAADDWCIQESIHNAVLTRNVQGGEALLAVMSRWNGPGKLQLIHNPLLKFMEQAKTTTMRGWVHLKIKKSWKKLYATCNPADATGMHEIALPVLCYFKDDRSPLELGRIALSLTDIYSAFPTKKCPTDHIFAVKPLGSNGADDSSCRFCCVARQEEKDMWMATLLAAKERKSA
jgi:hypothetical protein